MSRVVFITGASSGFGRETAERLATMDFRVYGTSRKGVNDTSGAYSMLKMDVRDADSIEAAVSEVLRKEGRIDVLVNNAGIGSYTALEETPMEDLEEMMDTNFKGPLRMCQAVLPGMRRQGSGLIINISSIAGLLGLPYMGTYSASKFALEGVMEALSMEVKSFGITVCLIEPGDFNTEMVHNHKKAALSPDSVYEKGLHQMARSSDQNMSKAPGPQAVAEKVIQIINTRNPRLRYRVGNFLEKLSIPLKTLLPSRLFEKIFLTIYGLDSPK